MTSPDDPGGAAGDAPAYADPARDANEDSGATDTGSGRGGPLGTPSSDTVERPPGEEEGYVVSGGGVADPGQEQVPDPSRLG